MMRGYKEFTLRVLREMEASPEFPGTTLAPTLSFLFWWALQNKPARILQLGTLIGYSAIVLADAVQDHRGRVVTVDPDVRKLDIARDYAARAGFRNDILFLEGSTLNTTTINALADGGPYGLIYLDTSHAYADTVQEIKTFTDPRFMRPDTLIVLHDTSILAQGWDDTGQGGVRRALREFEIVKAANLGLTVAWFDPPIFADTSGMALIYHDTAMRGG